MSLGQELADFLGGLVSRAAAAPEEERARIRAELQTALDRLDGIAPNAPAVHEAAERRRAELEAEELRRRQDEPTSRTELPTGRG